MDYNLTVNEKEMSFKAKLKDGQMDFQANGENTDVSFVRISAHQILLNINGQHVNAYILNETGEKGVRTIIINGRVYHVQDTDAFATGRTRKKGFLKNADTVSAPMPSVVISLLARTGDVVEKGQGLVVVSAMKMETTLYAPYGGKVVKINAGEGDKVMPNDILMDIEKTKEA